MQTTSFSIPADKLGGLTRRWFDVYGYLIGPAPFESTPEEQRRREWTPDFLHEIGERLAQAAEERRLDSSPLWNLNGIMLTVDSLRNNIRASVWDGAWNLVHRLEVTAKSELGRETPDPPSPSQPILDGIIEELSRDTKGATSKLKKPAETVLAAIQNEPDEVTLRGDRSGVATRLTELDKQHAGIKGVFIFSANTITFVRARFDRLVANSH